MTSAVIDDGGAGHVGARHPLRAPLTIRQLLTPAFYYRNRAIVAFLIPVLLAVIAALLAYPVYVAQSRLLILLGDDYVFQSGVINQTPSQTFDRPQIIHAELEILSSKDLRLRTLGAVGPARIYPSLAAEPNGMAEAEMRFAKDLTINDIPQSNVIELSLRNRDPHVAADALNQLVNLYIVRRREIFEQADLSSIGAQRDRLTRQLADAEKAITDFSVAHRFGDYSQDLAATQSQQTALMAQLQATDAQVAARKGRADQLRQRMAHTPETLQLSADTGRSQQLDTLTQELLSLQNQRRDTAAKYADNYPLVTDLDQRIAEVQGEIAKAPQQQPTANRRGVNPVHQQLDTSLADAEGDAAGLRDARTQIAQSLDAVNTRLDELLAAGPQYRSLVQARDLIADAASSLGKRLEDSQLSDILSRSRANVRVIQSADAPAKGTSGRLILLAAGVVAGCFAALATIVLSMAFSEVMVSPGDVEQKLDLPILLAVPDARRNARRTGLKPVHLTPEDSHLLMRLLASVPAERGRVLQIAAAREGEGASSLLLDIALIESAKSARRVLLIDVEPRPGHDIAATLAKQNIGLKREAGGRLMQVAGASLFVSEPLKAADLANGKLDWRKVLSRARETFDLILVDAPPLQRSGALLAAAPYADVILAVVEAEQTRAAVVRNLVDRIETAGGEVMGVILNKRRFYIPRLIYSWL